MAVQHMPRCNAPPDTSRQLKRQVIDALLLIKRVGGDDALDGACPPYVALTALAFLKRERGHHRLLYTLDQIEAAA